MTAAPLLQVPPDPVAPSAAQRPTGKRHPCADCQPLNPGSKMAHCSVCHVTFSTVGNFDRHNPSCSGCAHPAAVGLVPSRRSPGAWCQPGTDYTEGQRT